MGIAFPQCNAAAIGIGISGRSASRDLWIRALDHGHAAKDGASIVERAVVMFCR
jgi:hypothetical protein